jgi:hypothetical protein
VLLAALAGPRGAPPPEPVQASVSGDVLRRLESNVAREQAVRYLTEAQGVLLSVASRPPDCEKEKGRVDIADETRRSRELLARRALVDSDREAVASARGVLDEVEEVLRDVAALESCARARDLDDIQRQLERGRLLMKIDLMRRELQS